MTLRILGPKPFERDDEGRLKSRIATVFPRAGILVTRPGIHATQRIEFLEEQDRISEEERGAPLDETEQEEALVDAVDLILEEDSILIRPDVARLGRMFEGDEALQEIVSKRRIRFLNLQDERVRHSILRRGECWRIAPIPRSVPEMIEMIERSKIGIQGREIYYYNKATGTRWLTCEELEGLRGLDDAELGEHLLEIRRYSALRNAGGRPELAFFVASKAFLGDLETELPEDRVPGDVREVHARLVERFRARVPAHLRKDDPEDTEWRGRMFDALSPRKAVDVAEEVRLGLSAEFFMQIEWLPGARLTRGEVIIDPLFDEPSAGEGKGPPCDPLVRAFILNFVREYDDLEYVNVGRLPRRLSLRPRDEGRRDVYVVELKERGRDREDVKVIRMQKWGVREKLDEGKPLLQAIEDTEEYTDYVLDRRLGCRQLGMSLPARVIPRKLCEVYDGPQGAYRGRRIWSPYFERDYVHGIATDKIPAARFEDQEFAERFAEVLGEAAASNLIVGRGQWSPRDAAGRKRFEVIFDDGDEILEEGPEAGDFSIVVAGHVGSFANYDRPLVDFLDPYAGPVLSRQGVVPDPAAFAEAYVSSFSSSFRRIQTVVARRGRAFHSLFRDRPLDEHGSFGYRWKRVLERLSGTDADALVARLRESLKPAT